MFFDFSKFAFTFCMFVLPIIILGIINAFVLNSTMKRNNLQFPDNNLDEQPGSKKHWSYWTHYFLGDTMTTVFILFGLFAVGYSCYQIYFFS